MITTKNILCFGDSNTFGYIPSGKGRYEEDVRWTGILQDSLRDRDYHVIEEGLCGRTTVFHDPYREGRCGADVFPGILESHAPLDVIIIMLGTNDCKKVYNASAQTIGKGIEKLLGQIRDKSPKSKVIIASPILLGKGVWEEGFDQAFNENSYEVSKRLPEVYRKIADKYGTYYFRASDYAEPSELDREHMDVSGHRSLARAITDMILKIINDDGNTIDESQKV